MEPSLIRNFCIAATLPEIGGEGTGRKGRICMVFSWLKMSCKNLYPYGVVKGEGGDDQSSL